MKKILIMGLPGSGKSTLAFEINKKLKAQRLNADKVRKKYNDWDFSKKGVLRQAKRMKILASKSKKKYVIADFICPLKKGRMIFDPDYLIWLDTIKKGRLPTFDKIFEKPKKFDFKISKKDAKKYSKLIVLKIKIDTKKNKK
jgi:adenylylsulfate kinase